MVAISDKTSTFTWTIDGTPTTGTFANGDKWVLDSGGGLNCSAITPAPTTGPFGDGLARNGSMINPVVAAGVSTWQEMGYDGRDRATAAPSAGSTCPFVYNSALNVALDLPNLSLSSGDTLISAESYNNGSNDNVYGGANAGVLESLAPLTVVGTDLTGTDYFRPAYAGTTKTLYSSSAIDYDKKLGTRLTSPFDPTTGENVDFVTGTTRGLDFVYDMPFNTGSAIVNGQYLHGLSLIQYYPGTAGTGIGSLIAQALCYCLCGFTDSYDVAKKIIQYGIDVAGVRALDAGIYQMGAGYGVGRGPALTFAGYMLGDNDMLTAWRDDVNSAAGFYQDFNGNYRDTNKMYNGTMFYNPNTCHPYTLPRPRDFYTNIGIPVYASTAAAAFPTGYGANHQTEDPNQVYEANPLVLNHYPYKDGSNTVMDNGGGYMQCCSMHCYPGVYMAFAKLGLLDYMPQSARYFTERWLNDPNLWQGCAYQPYIGSSNPLRQVLIDRGTSNAVVVDTPLIAEYGWTNNMQIVVTLANNLTGAATITIPNLGTKSLYAAKSPITGPTNHTNTSGTRVFIYRSDEDAFFDMELAQASFGPASWYTQTATSGNLPDIRGFGGSGNGWMLRLYIENFLQKQAPACF